MAQHPTKAMISAYRALDAAYSKTHGRCCCTYRHGPWECPFVCQLCSKHAHEPWFMRAVHKPRFILAFRISRTTGTADHGLCTRFGFVNHDLCLFQRALLSSGLSSKPRGAPRSGKLFRHQRKSTAKIDPPPETVVLKKLFAGKLCSYLAVSKFIS